MSTGRVVGTAGVGLDDNPGWASSASAAKRGQAAEKRMGKLLNDAALLHGATVLHDLAIPIPSKDGRRPNIDHVWVSGNRVIPIDTKIWREGRYWTMPFTGHSFIGTERAEHLEKQTMRMASQSLPGFLAGTTAQVQTPLVAVFGKANTAWLRIPGARVIDADSLVGHLLGLGVEPADDAVVLRLKRLVADPDHDTAVTRARASHQFPTDRWM